jgi:hypothetical protein
MIPVWWAAAGELLHRCDGVVEVLQLGSAEPCRWPPGVSVVSGDSGSAGQRGYCQIF